MDYIQAALLQEHSKTQTLKIIAYIEEDVTQIEALMTCFFASEYRISQRASWAVGLIAEKYPELILPYLPKMIDNLDAPKHDAIVRNTLRTLRCLEEIPSELEGKIIDKCFDYLINPKNADAIRAFSIHVLAKICSNIPELKEELRLTLEDLLQHEKKASFISAARNTLKQIVK